MKLAAHPLVVAVALGVLPAHALAEERDEEATPGCADCGDDGVVADRSPLPMAEADGVDEASDAAIDALLDALRDLPADPV